MHWIDLWKTAPANDNATVRVRPRIRSVFVVTSGSQSLEVVAGLAASANDEGGKDGGNPEVAK